LNPGKQLHCKLPSVKAVQLPWLLSHSLSSVLHISEHREDCIIGVSKEEEIQIGRS